MKVDFNFPHKTAAENIIHKCQSEGAYAVLAGGYLRDHILGKPFKDMDFFIYVPNDNPYLFEEGLLDAIGYDFDTGFMEDMGEQYDGGNCLKVTIDSLIYNFVQVYQEPSRYVSTRFDYSINQLYYDGVTIKRSKAFLDTIKTRQVKCINQPNNPKRLEYLRAKFPEFVFPDLEKRQEASLWGSTEQKKVKIKLSQYAAQYQQMIHQGAGTTANTTGVQQLDANAINLAHQAWNTQQLGLGQFLATPPIAPTDPIDPWYYAAEPPNGS